MTLVSPEMRERLSAEQNHRCAYCGCSFGGDKSFATVDHVRARSAGGTNAWLNLVMACRRCNELRGNQNALKFFASRAWERETRIERGRMPSDWRPEPARAATLGCIWPTHPTPPEPRP